MLNRRLLIVSLAVLLCTSMLGPAVVAGATTQSESNPDVQTENGVTVTTGAQLSTVVTATSDDVRSDFEDTAFDERMEQGNDSARAAAIAGRAAVLENRSIALQAEYERATAAYEGGDLEESAYAQRLASLNTRARNVVSSYERLEERAESVETVELRAAGVTLSDLADERTAVAELTSAGTNALTRQFTGEASGNVEIDLDGGMSIEVESDDGERSREYERPRDGNGSLSISQTDALATATAALSATSNNSSWTVSEAERDAEDGVYEFEFVLTGAETGEAEVSVDGETGTVFELEEAIERRANDEDIDEEAAEDDEATDANDTESLVFLVADGSPGPGEQVTLQLLANGQPATDVAITVNDRTVGETDANGTLTVTLPRDEVEIEADNGDAEGELEFEFEFDDETDDSDDERDTASQLNADAAIDNGTVTVSVTFNGSPVSDAAVIANDETVGHTGDAGTVSFATPNGTDELEVEVVRGELETELEIDLETEGDGNAEADEEAAEDDEEGADDEEDEESDEEGDTDEEEDNDDDNDDEETDEDEPAEDDDLETDDDR
ncbi:PepSY domain-containing protein [Natrinema sp. HArc-T2]|uniref:DUF7096 domain-containing protein n=1 Tax=Natrinema sp. HArc-T2 TaxID=3242701 RepID=UPI00359E7FD6